jgi:acyl-coenzyme A synthetase/AMP-(fatty) acid ligase
VIEAADGVGPSDAFAAELIAYCRERTAHFKCPRSVEVIELIPRQDNGKLYRNQLRDQYRRTRTGAPPA